MTTTYRVIVEGLYNRDIAEVIAAKLDNDSAKAAGITIRIEEVNEDDE